MSSASQDSVETDRSEACRGRVHIDIADRQRDLAVNHELLLRIAESVLSGEQTCNAELSIALVSDSEIHDVNRRFLDHDDPTDVVSFLLNEEGPESGRLDAEIVISTETAVRSAAELGGDSHDELALYLVHGLLHLCGYDDQTPEDRRRMQEREKSHLKMFGILPHYED